MKLPSFLNGNWGLKLLAFVLAVVVYYTIHYAINNESAQGGRSNDRSFLKQNL